MSTDPQEQARILSEALPHMQQYDEETIVIKYGGHAMTDSSLKERFAQDVVLLKYVGINPVIIHGGGPQIDKMLDRLGIQAKFRHGVRITDATVTTPPTHSACTTSGSTGATRVAGTVVDVEVDDVEVGGDGHAACVP